MSNIPPPPGQPEWYPPPPPGGYGAPPPGYGPPGGYGGPGAGMAKPANYLVPSILVTLFCCLPLGIVAIVFAAQVDSKWNSGDVAGAQDAAQKAKTWTWVSFGIGLAVIAFYVLAIGSITFLGESAEPRFEQIGDSNSDSWRDDLQRDPWLDGLGRSQPTP